ncbi:MAG: VanZ family protein [Tannerellaceae bacterium]
MLYYLKKYPVSITLILTVIYLSFFRPPDLEIGRFPGIDKLAHICMYGGLSGALWLEFLRNHHKYDEMLWHAWIGAVLCPIAMSGVIELLQEYCTTYRGGDWFDFLANTCGVALATLLSYYLIRPWMAKRQLN